MGPRRDAVGWDENGDEGQEKRSRWSWSGLEPAARSADRISAWQRVSAVAAHDLG